MWGANIFSQGPFEQLSPALGLFSRLAEITTHNLTITELLAVPAGLWSWWDTDPCVSMMRGLHNHSPTFLLSSLNYVALFLSSYNCLLLKNNNNKNKISSCFFPVVHQIPIFCWIKHLDVLQEYVHIN